MKIKIRDNLDDWQQLYINGKLVLSGHSIPLESLLTAIKKEPHGDNCEFDFQIIEWDFELGKPLYD